MILIRNYDEEIDAHNCVVYCPILDDGCICELSGGEEDCGISPLNCSIYYGGFSKTEIDMMGDIMINLETGELVVNTSPTSRTPETYEDLVEKMQWWCYINHIEQLGCAMGLSDNQIMRAIRKNVDSLSGMRRIEKNTRGKTDEQILAEDEYLWEELQKLREYIVNM